AEVEGGDGEAGFGRGAGHGGADGAQADPGDGRGGGHGMLLGSTGGRGPARGGCGRPRVGVSGRRRRGGGRPRQPGPARPRLCGPWGRGWGPGRSRRWTGWWSWDAPRIDGRAVTGAGWLWEAERGPQRATAAVRVSTTSARACSPPTLPGKTTYGMPMTSSGASRAENRETCPAQNWPSTSARRMPRPEAATSWEVMPPLATTQAGRASRTRWTTSTTASETLR